jgi:predicted nucleic acid-binding protein
VIYLDTSVVLAELLAEDRHPAEGFWREPLVSSRLLTFEVWTRVNARGLGSSHTEAARALLARLAWLELDAPVLARALEPFPAPVRTLDALHLASAHFLRERDASTNVATYDRRLAKAAGELGFDVFEP